MTTLRDHMMPRTHLRAHPAWIGRSARVEPGAATAELQTTPDMAVDEEGLVHGGFVFGLADYAAMLAVNEPTVVLAAAEVRFVAPVRAGELVVATARVVDAGARKHRVEVTCQVGQRVVLTGVLTAAVLDRHVLERP